MTSERSGGEAGGSARPGQAFDPECELCEAAPITERFFEDDLCWIAECEACSVPMVVWKSHDPDPPEEIRVELRSRLAAVVAVLVERDARYERWSFDDRLRTIPTHYHAHARPRIW